VIAITKGLVLRQAAAAERDYFSARQSVFFSFRIMYRKIPFNADWSIIVHRDFS
jgi:hypothetical protein